MSRAGLSRSNRPLVAIWDLDERVQMARLSFSVFLTIDARLSLFSSPSRIPAKKLLLGCVTAILMGFTIVDGIGDILVSSELYSESSAGICILGREGYGLGQMEDVRCHVGLPQRIQSEEPLNTCSGGSAYLYPQL